MLTKTIYIVRHGETILNEAHIRQGEDGKLSPNGKSQAFATGQRLVPFGIKKIFTSPFPRALETSEEIVKSCPVPVEYVPLFAERKNPSTIIGRSYEDPITVDAINFMDKTYHAPEARWGDEENFDDLKKRAIRARDFLQKNADDRSLVITHGIFLKMFLCVLIYGDKLQIENYIRLTLFNPAGNAGITVIEYNPIKFFSNPWEIIAYNDGPVDRKALQI